MASRPARQLLAVWGLRLAVLLGVLTAAAQVVSYHYGLRDHILDSSSDNSVVGGLTALLLGASVAIAWLLALTRKRPQLFLLAACLSVLFAFELTHPPHKVAISTPFGIAAVVVLWRLAADDPLARRLLHAGCVVLAFAFVGHSAGSWLVDRLGLGPDSWLYQLKAIVKHAGELAAWTLIASGLAAVRLEPLEEDVREVGARADEPEAQLVLVHELRERP